MISLATVSEQTLAVVTAYTFLTAFSLASIFSLVLLFIVFYLMRIQYLYTQRVYCIPRITRFDYYPTIYFPLKLIGNCSTSIASLIIVFE